MKKLLIAILALTSISAFADCGNNLEKLSENIRELNAVAKIETVENFTCLMIDIHTGYGLAGSSYSVQIVTDEDGAVGAAIYTHVAVPGSQPQLWLHLQSLEGATISQVFSAVGSRTPVEFIRNGKKGLLSIQNSYSTSTFNCNLN